ncbi:carbohydrate esterase family 1 protein [Schizophyllum amplum]|uniref:feruloyl esterase n=1 Tax=Schizophyllum amplum TaxID=97359 RepID=A0A550CQU3_9AGAR|nr:carbohydrate esterase family 1 protein [Auriculariopsis ampla]
MVIASLLLLLTATQSSASPSPRSASSPRSPNNALLKSSGCGSSPSWDFNSKNHHTRNTTVDDHERQYLIHLPNDYDVDTAYPVVLSFHGANGNSAGQEDASQLSYDRQRLADRRIIAVYPQGVKGAWESAPYAEADAHDSDIRFVSTILDELEDNLCLDRNRVYSSGFSNGGGFNNLLACTPSINKRVAAFGLASGAYYPAAHPGSSCKPGRKVPVLMTHGDGDPQVHYHGEHTNASSHSARLSRLPNISHFAKDWAERNGFERDGYKCTRMEGTDKVHIWTWGGDDDDDEDAVQVQRYRVLGMNHIWPTTIKGQQRKHEAAPFNLTEQVLLPFFEKYTLSL